MIRLLWGSMPVKFGIERLMATSDTGGEVKEEDWTSSISIENERFAAYL